MSYKFKPSSPIVIFFGSLVVVWLILVYFSFRLNKQVSSISSDSVKKNTQRKTFPKRSKGEKKKTSKEFKVERKEITPTDSVVDKPAKHKIILKKDRDSGYTRYRFFENEELIASYREHNDEITELTGQIPDGEMEIINRIAHTTGTVNYANQKPHGDFKEFDGFRNLIREGRYYRGKLVSLKEYYDDGQLKLEQNFYTTLTDTKFSSILPSGSGTRYYSNGTLKEKWDFSFNDSEYGFIKKFDQEGNIISSKKFDKIGNPASY